MAKRYKVLFASRRDFEMTRMFVLGFVVPLGIVGAAACLSGLLIGR